MKTIKEAENELMLKKLRVDYWESYGFVPTDDYLKERIEWGEGA